MGICEKCGNATLKSYPLCPDCYEQAKTEQETKKKNLQRKQPENPKTLSNWMRRYRTVRNGWVVFLCSVSFVIGWLMGNM